MPSTVQLAQCYFCTTRIIVPIGHHPSSGPLVCETCFAVAVARHRELQRQQEITHPSRIPQQPVIPPAVPHLPTSYTTLSLPGPQIDTDGLVHTPPSNVAPGSHQRRHSIVSPPPAAWQVRFLRTAHIWMPLFTPIFRALSPKVRLVYLGPLGGPNQTKEIMTELLQR